MVLEGTRALGLITYDLQSAFLRSHVTKEQATGWRLNLHPLCTAHYTVAMVTTTSPMALCQGCTVHAPYMGTEQSPDDLIRAPSGLRARRMGSAIS